MFNMAASIEKIVEEVRKREILYASSFKAYKDVAKKEAAWKEVAEAVGVTDAAGGYYSFWSFGLLGCEQ